MKIPNTEQLQEENTAYRAQKMRAQEAFEEEKRARQQRERKGLILWGGFGLFLGVVVALFLIATGIIPLLQGTVAKYYYVVKFEDALAWLEENEALDDALTEDLGQITELPSWSEIRAVFPDAKDTVIMSLEAMHSAMLGEGAGEDSEVLACLALKDDPMSSEGPVEYLYVQVPTAQIRNISVPEAWEPNEKPENSLFWMVLSCYPE